MSGQGERRASSFLARNEPSQTEDSEQILHQSYHVGIIDYLQEYNTKKKLELKLKSLFVSSDEARTLSVSNPDYYQQRFKKFMYEKVFSKHVGGVQME